MGELDKQKHPPKQALGKWIGAAQSRGCSLHSCPAGAAGAAGGSSLALESPAATGLMHSPNSLQEPTLLQLE